ncbi:TetR/AcrR family transcriptional regulator [Pseudomonas luteola]|uniref:TetR/AcrR family transcriptional regulator n=1 Tax=Pseudomonas luteola TaxID=47886 RepID=UPI003A8B14BF
MPWPTTQRATTRQRILDSSAKLFALYGYDSVSIDMVMEEAELTRGAFYHHFKSKADLYERTLHSAAIQGGQLLEEAGTKGLEGVVRNYLQMDHRNGERMHCPLAFMINDCARQDGFIQESYTQIFSSFVARLEKALTVSPTDNKRQQALRMATTMIGGVALARAVNDEQLAEQILSACQKQCLELLTDT